MITAFNDPPPQYFNPEEFKFDDPPAPKDPDYDIEYDF